MASFRKILPKLSLVAFGLTCLLAAQGTQSSAEKNGRTTCQKAGRSPASCGPSPAVIFPVGDASWLSQVADHATRRLAAENYLRLSQVEMQALGMRQQAFHHYGMRVAQPMLATTLYRAPTVAPFPFTTAGAAGLSVGYAASSRAFWGHFLY